jgi:hypothetical protein
MAVPGASDAAFKNAQEGSSLAEYTEAAKYDSPSAFDLRIIALNFKYCSAIIPMPVDGLRRRRSFRFAFGNSDRSARE